MGNLVDMQKHIDALRGSLAQEKDKNEMLKSDLCDTLEKLSDSKNKALWFKVWFIIASISFSLSLLLIAMLYDANDQWEQSVILEQEKTADAEQRVKNCIEFIKMQDKEIQELRKANSTMINYGCNKKIDKAIKATQLPQFKKEIA